jgi:hemin uptake protein HemP
MERLRYHDDSYIASARATHAMNRCGCREIRMADRAQPSMGWTLSPGLARIKNGLAAVAPDNENRYYSCMKREERPPIESKTASPDSDANRSVPRVSSRELMRRHSELIIEHDGREYHLRITHSGKLILTA